MKSLLFYLVVVPIGILLIVLGVINRELVTVVLDPFSPADPTVAVKLPLYLLVFGAVVFGIVIGGAADWLRQGRHRRAARERGYEAQRWKEEAAALKNAPAPDRSTGSVPALTAPRAPDR